MPKEVSDDELYQVAAFRSEQRIPALVWIDKHNGASLWRSSQPLCGMSGSCAMDEKVIDIIAHSCGSKATLLIADCRPVASALANRAAGAGYETNANYPHAKLEFMGITNVHSVRESFKALNSFIVNGSGPNGDLLFGAKVSYEVLCTDLCV